MIGVDRDHGSGRDRVLDAFRLEAEQLSHAVTGLSGPDWDRVTRCDPWRVRDLLAHLRIVIGWLPGMLAAPAPARAEVSAVQYYRPDHRYTPTANTTRIRLAQDHAATLPDGDLLAVDFTAIWQQVDRLCRAEPEERVVTTRHGDAMLLSQFLLTRVVEIAVHGLDLADALHRDPWLTPHAADLIEELLLGPNHAHAVRQLGWDQPTFLRKATGRQPLTDTDLEQVNRLGIHWLTLG